MFISNTEVKSFQGCQRRHYYSFRERLASSSGKGKAFTRGIIGHEALEHYYKAKQDGEPRATCLEAMKVVLDESEEKYPEFIQEITQLRDVLKRYDEFYWDEPWVILEVERQHETLLDNKMDISYGMRLDLLVEHNGDIVLVDHKFVYNFWTDKELKMNTQLQKYMFTLKQNGIPVKRALLNQIRYRELDNPEPEKIFQRTLINSSVQEQARVMWEHEKVAKDIAKLYDLPMMEHFRQSYMHLDKLTCGKCPFMPLCKEWLGGKDSSETKRVLYTRDDYMDQYDELTVGE